MQHFKLFIIAMVVFFITDMIWLGLIANSWYLKQYETWLRLQNGQLQPLWWAIPIIYFLFALATLVFILPLAKGSLLSALLYGSAMGFIIYGVYDFTCLAIFKDWPVSMAFVDWIWGTFLCGFSATMTLYLSRFI